jgi:exopolysaccharide production protein ExoY
VGIQDRKLGLSAGVQPARTTFERLLEISGAAASRLVAPSSPISPSSAQTAGTASQGAVGGLTKRVFDVVLTVGLLIVALPLGLTVALLLKLSTDGPILFAHERIGLNGRRFFCFKFRTMVQNSAEVLEQHLASDPAAAEEWVRTQKLRHDPRITKLGTFLRRSSLDELPQLLNVLRGEMSCVGPRPVVRAELARYGQDAQTYLSARPGLTGLWQVSGRSSTGYAERISLDVQYVRHWSIGGDIRILFRTLPALLRFHQSA